jgi:LETM1 and EF-hand domain-containing protein 1
MLRVNSRQVVVSVAVLQQRRMFASPPGEVATKVRYYFAKLKDGTVHSWHWLRNGSTLFRKNFAISKGLLSKKLKGDELTFRESQLLVKTTADVLKLIPFSFFIIVPFAELLLPVVLKVWPQMLPSTFDAKKLFGQSAATERSRRLLAKQEMLKFFSEISIRQDMDALSKKAAEDKARVLLEFKKLLAKPRQVGQPLPSVEELQKVSSLFQSELKLDNMPMKNLEAICYIIGLEPYPFRSHVILQLKRYIGKVKREDRNISWEGIDSLTRDELIEANRRRGMPHEDTRDSVVLKQQLRNWIKLSSNRTIPMSVLLWARAFFVTENPDLLEIEQALPSTSSDITFTTTSDAGESTVGDTSRLKQMSDDVLKRIAELEHLEQEAQDSSFNVGVSANPEESEIEKHLERQIEVIEQKSLLIKSQLQYLKKIKKLRRNSKIDLELRKIEKSFSHENRRIDSLIRNVLKEPTE